MNNPDHLKNLYQELIMDHAKNPRNRDRLRKITHQARGDNPLCGDHLELFLTIEGGVIKKVGFNGQGCALSTAAASLLSEEIEGLEVAKARKLARQMISLLKTGVVEPDLAAHQKLLVFKNVREFPGRVKCAGLSFYTLEEALGSNQKNDGR